MKTAATTALLLLAVLLGTTFTTAKSAPTNEEDDDFGEVLDLTYSNISLAYKGDWILVIYAEWCGHCQSLMKILPEVAHEVEGKVKVARVEGSDTFWTQMQFFIEGYPTIYHIHDGQVRLYDGDRDIDEMAEFALEKWVNTPAIPYWKSPTALHIRMLAGYAEFVRIVYVRIEMVADELDVDPIVLTVVFAVVCCLLCGLSLFLSARSKKKQLEKMKIKKQQEQQQQQQQKEAEEKKEDKTEEKKESVKKNAAAAAAKTKQPSKQKPKNKKKLD